MKTTRGKRFPTTKTSLYEDTHGIRVLLRAAESAINNADWEQYQHLMWNIETLASASRGAARLNTGDDQ